MIRKMATTPPETVESHRHERKFAIAIILIALTVGAVSFWVLYSQFVVSNTAVNGIEFEAASNAVDSLTVTCISASLDTSKLPASSIVLVTVGVQNPSNLSMDTTWTLNLNCTNAYVFLSSTETFHLSPSATLHPTFHLTLLDYQNTALQYAIDRSYHATIDASFQVTGTHGIYTITRTNTYDNAISGSFENSLSNYKNTTPNCA